MTYWILKKLGKELSGLQTLMQIMLEASSAKSPSVLLLMTGCRIRKCDLVNKSSGAKEGVNKSSGAKEGVNKSSGAKEGAKEGVGKVWIRCRQGVVYHMCTYLSESNMQQ